jgi:hypothetical protein
MRWDGLLAGRLAGAASAAGVCHDDDAGLDCTGTADSFRAASAKHFIVTCVGLAALCGAAYSRSRSSAAILGFGLFAGAATIYKPNAAIYFPALLAWTFWLARTTRAPDRSGLRRPILVALAGAAVVPLIVLLWLWKIDVLAEAKIRGRGLQPLVRVGRFSTFRLRPDLLRLCGLPVEDVTEPLWIAGVAGSFAMCGRSLDAVSSSPFRRSRSLGRRRRARHHRQRHASVLHVLRTGARPLSIVAGLVAHDMVEGKPDSAGDRGCCLAVSAIVLVREHYVPKVWDDLASNMGELTDVAITRRSLTGLAPAPAVYSARAHEELATYIKARTGPDDRIFLFGHQRRRHLFPRRSPYGASVPACELLCPGEFPDPRFRSSL